MWEFVRVSAKDPVKVGEYLKGGYEPFAVTVDKYDLETVWLRREKDALQKQAGAGELPEKVLPKKRGKTKN